MMIESERDYHAALTEIETLMNAEIDTPEGQRLDELVAAVQAYETIHYDLDRP